MNEKQEQRLYNNILYYELFHKERCKEYSRKNISKRRIRANENYILNGRATSELKCEWKKMEPIKIEKRKILVEFN